MAGCGKDARADDPHIVDDVPAGLSRRIAIDKESQDGADVQETDPPLSRGAEAEAGEAGLQFTGGQHDPIRRRPV